MRRGPSWLTVAVVDETRTAPFPLRLSSRQWVALDVTLAVAVGLTTVVGILVVTPEPHPAGPAWNALRIAGAVVLAGALPWRRRYPARVLGVVVAGVAVLVALGTKGPALLVLVLAMYTLASEGGLTRRASFSALVATAVTMAVAALAAGPDWGSLLTGPLLAVAGWLAGENARSRRAQAAAAVVEREDRVRRAATDERMRIARELHDVIAHAMSVIAVRSGVARMVLDTQPDQAREALGIIEETSREALQQMRQLVGVLRQPGDASDLGPAPGLVDLPGLVEGIGQAGVAVDVRVEGPPRRLPPALDLSVYRIIQEALTNVARHAGPTSAVLRIAYSPESIELEVTDHGAAAPVSSNGGGHGLLGMRERVTLYGGELSAGPTADGFRVLARLPIAGGAE